MTTCTHGVSLARSNSATVHSQATHPASMLKTWWDAFWSHRAHRATVMMLRALDDRSLHDIGLDRSEIESVVYGKGTDRVLRYKDAA